MCSAVRLGRAYLAPAASQGVLHCLFIGLLGECSRVDQGSHSISEVICLPAGVCELRIGAGHCTSSFDNNGRRRAFPLHKFVDRSQTAMAALQQTLISARGTRTWAARLVVSGTWALTMMSMMRSSAGARRVGG